MKKWRKKNEPIFSSHRRNALLCWRILRHDFSSWRPD
nr:MAG TPA: hypothetical protein [Caudoviricetes sp.]